MRRTAQGMDTRPRSRSPGLRQPVAWRTSGDGHATPEEVTVSTVNAAAPAVEKASPDTPTSRPGRGRGSVSAGAHDDVVPRLAEHLQPVFESSLDGVYIWLDETHWTCNEKFARLFGFTVAELENSPGFLQRFVDEGDQEQFSWNYWNRVQGRAFPVTFRFNGRDRDGSALAMETDMIPLAYGGHRIAYHFVRRSDA
jgi:PAS domain S-box-containing protein